MTTTTKTNTTQIKADGTTLIMTKETPTVSSATGRTSVRYRVVTEEATQEQYLVRDYLIDGVWKERGGFSTVEMEAAIIALLDKAYGV